MKKILLALMVALLLIVVTSCAGGEEEWNGTFYNYLEDDHVLAITFEREGSSEGIYGSTAEIMTDNGIAKVEVSVSAELTKKNTAEDNRGYRYVLKGDTLTVKYVDDDEVFGTDFSGTYTRSASIEETFDLDDDDEGDAMDFGNSASASNSIVLEDFYYRDGTYGDISLYFYDDGEVDIDYPDGTQESYDYTIEDGKITLYENGLEELTLTIIDPSTLAYEEGGYQFITLDASGSDD